MEIMVTEAYASSDDDDLQGYPAVIALIRFDGEQPWYQLTGLSLVFDSVTVIETELAGFINEWRERAVHNGIEFTLGESVEDLIDNMKGENDD